AHLSPLSLHDALPIFHFFRPAGTRLSRLPTSATVIVRRSHIGRSRLTHSRAASQRAARETPRPAGIPVRINPRAWASSACSALRSEEHTSELQSRRDL